ncbi:MAG: PAS domain-containing sensor histidine kinase [Micavibrio aeruginosavorus]|uniref:histidine kinase n=1 Tax=Micavibrio aeruginosavorus TaxID=349221 RepID=A0A7T5UH84_9BACT|nr:MAG: PAS domain-containing sensor histidine kinase [Micavibrio aeruginosavorus]
MSNLEQENGDDSGSVRVKRMLTGGVPQFMVFLNGMILTVVAYLILSLFMRDIIFDEYRRAIEEARDTIAGRVEDAQDDLQMLSTILTLSGASTGEMARVRIQKAIPNHELFDHLIWIYPTPEGWRFRDLLEGMGSQSVKPELSGERAKFLVQHVLANRGQIADAPFALTDLSASDYVQEVDEPIVKSRSYIVAHNLRDAANDRGVLAAVTRMSLIADTSWMVDKSMIRRLTINDNATGKRLFLIDRSQNNIEEEGAKGDYRHGFELDVLGDVWKVEIVVGADRNTLFMSQSPLLLLLFGLTLTIVGTLYVRTNQRQSYRLSTVNRALAQKNYELNTEMAERERLNQSLRKAEREYRAIIDSVSDIIFELSADGEILFLNETWPRITGYEIEQSVNRNLFDMLHPQDQEEQKSAFRQMVAGKRPAYRAFTRLRTSSGVYHAAELAMSMLRQDENKQTRVVGTITDVEERRRTERALTEAEKKYRTIVENAAGGIYQVTPDGHFLSVNPAYARILGYDSPDHVMKAIRNAHEQLYAKPRERAKFVRDLELNGQVKAYEAEMITRKGDVIWVSENARAVRDDDGNILYYEGSLENISQRKEADTKMREAMIQSDLANRAKSEFLANMSHELRTPLNAIIGFSEIIRNEVFGAINHRQYWEYAKDIHESGKQLLRIINDILDVSRIDAGDRQLNESLVDMKQMIQTCMSFMGGRIEEAKLVINDATGENLPNVVGEELAIKQSLLNILSNAVKFTQPGGSITFTHEIDADGRLRLSVTDTGVGMEEEEVEKALSPFGQLETSLSRSSSGAGLGLTLVTSLMELHGGDLELVSQKGIGTTATLVFPKKRVVLDSVRKGKQGSTASGFSADEEGDPPTTRTIQ